MTNCSFTVSLRTVSSIMTTADSFNASIVRNTDILSKSVVTFKNVTSVLLQSIIITTVHSKAISSLITVSTAILSMQLDSSSAEFTENS